MLVCMMFKSQFVVVGWFMVIMKLVCVSFSTALQTAMNLIITAQPTIAWTLKPQSNFATAINNLITIGLTLNITPTPIAYATKGFVFSAIFVVAFLLLAFFVIPAMIILLRRKR